MSVIGSPIETSLVQAAQAQQVAAKDRDREKASKESAARRFQDIIDLRVAGVEGAQAPRQVPANDSQQSESEHRSHDHSGQSKQDQPRVDVQA